jgi:glycosyltransferase involved in cell wall biosynthesis
MNNFFTIAIDTCNHEDWIERCIKTCVTQRYDNFEVILVDAISDDKTYKIAEKLAENFNNLKIYQNKIRLPQVANFLWLVKLSKPNSIVVSIDGDDWLKNSNVLKKLNDAYNSREVWMTYGTYEEFPYRNVSKIYQPYPDDVIINNSFREHRWLASHLRTFKRELFLKINEEDFKRKDGEWLDTAGDQAIMLPMLEMSGERSKHMSDALYVYNVANTSRDGAINEPRQVEMANYVRSLNKYEKLESLW